MPKIDFMPIQKEISKIIIIIMFTSVIFVAQVFADNIVDPFFPSQVMSGQAADRRDVQHAVNRFCEELDINPNGKTVHENLNAALGHPDLTAQQKSDVLLLEDLLSYIDNLQKRVRYFSSKTDALKDRLVDEGYDASRLMADLFGIRNNATIWQKAPIYQSPSGQRDFLAIMNGLLEGEKQELFTRLEILQDQYHWLRSIKNNGWHASSRHLAQVGEIADSALSDDFIKVISREELPSVQSNEEDRFLSKFTLKEKDAADVVVLKSISAAGQPVEEESLRGLKKEMLSLYAQLDELQGRVGEGNSKIEDLAKQVVDLSLKLSETEAMLNDEAQESDSLRVRLTDVEQRFMLGQRIIQEKSLEIQSLQEDLQLARLEAGTQKEKLNYNIALKDRRLAEFEAFLGVYRDDLDLFRKEMRKKAVTLNRAKKELAELRRQVTENPKTEMAVRQKVNGDSILESKDEKLIELSGILEIYKDKLGEGTQTLKESMESITVLDRRLKDMENELQEKDKKLIETQRNLSDLENQLTTMKDELLELKSDHGQDES